MTSNYQNIIFDLDGTLINSSQEVLICFEKSFKKANYDLDLSRLTSDIIGPPLRGILEILAPELTDENKINEILENFRFFYDNDENDISIMYDGILELLQKLKNEGKRLFVATFKPQIPTERILKMFRLENFFDDVYTIDKFGEHISKEEMIFDILKRYSLDKEKTVMIGDAPSDVIAAQNAQVTGVGVLWGYGSDKSELIKNSAIVVETIAELRKII